MSATDITFDFAPAEPELFAAEAVAMDSPRLAWMKRHKVFTHQNEHMELPWCAWCDIADPSEYLSAHGESGFGYGDTEDDALGELALGWGWKLWNEEAS